MKFGRETMRQGSALPETEAESVPPLAGTVIRKTEKAGITKKNKAKKDRDVRQYTEILEDLSAMREKNANPVERCVSLLLELRRIRELPEEQIHDFFVTAEGVLGEAWAPFLTKASLNVDPNKMGNDFLICEEIINSCEEILEDCGLDRETIIQVSKSFCETKDADIISRYLTEVEQHKPRESKNSDANAVRIITSQELACVAYVCFTLDCRSYAPASYNLLVKIDRAIAEHFSKVVMKEQAGKTVGNILSSRSFSPKKIAELTYMYGGTTDTIRQQTERIAELNAEAVAVKARNAELESDIKDWKGAHADLIEKVRNLETERDRLREERIAAEGMLEYERNKFHRQMETKEAGLADQLSENLSLEIQAIRETVEYVDEDNQRRILRRLQRIDKILQEFGGAEDAEYRN